MKVKSKTKTKMSEKDLQFDRNAEATQLVEDFELTRDADFFKDPSNRLEFLSLLDYEDFFNIAQHVNARVRGFEPRDKKTVGDKGAYLPMLATPRAEEKPVAFEAGFDVIQAYLNESEDSVEEKIKGVGMAVEALIIWVHPYNDGNGRTSRFLGKFIEDGTSNVDQLIEETASKRTRQREYGGNLRVDQGNMVKGMDLILDDDEIKEFKKTEMPADKGISLSIKRLLENKAYQHKVDTQTQRYLNQRAEYERRRDAA